MFDRILTVTTIYERPTPPIKMKKDLITLKEIPVKIQKNMNFGKNFRKFLSLSEAL